MAEQTKVINGVDVEKLNETAKSLKANPELAKFRFEATNEWDEGGLNHTTIERYHGAGEDFAHSERFELHADEPPVLLSRDQAPNPVEHLLNALASCMTTSMVYHAAARGIGVDAVHSELKGDLDVRGFMGLAPDVRKGYEKIDVTFYVKSDGTEEQLRECAEFSPVYDVVSRGTDVNVEIIKQ